MNCILHQMDTIPWNHVLNPQHLHLHIWCEKYDRWIKVIDKARIYILANLIDVLAKKHVSMITPSKIMDSLRDMFEQKSTQTKLDGLKFIFKTRMKEGTSVREHVLNMLVHFNVAEMNGAITN